MADGGWLLGSTAWLYGRVIARRNRRYDLGRRARRLPVPVVSVGNLSAGGVGKSPMVAWMAERLLERRLRPVIAMRGYGARPGELSDEQAEYASRVPRVPVVAAPRRYEAVRAYLAAHDDVDGVLLDDGFQHRSLQRDLDVVLLDARDGPLDGRLLPAGRLREPPSSLGRADAVVVTHATEVDAPLAEAVRRHARAAPIAWTRHVWRGLRVHERREERGGEGIERVGVTRDVSWLEGRRVLTVLGVGRPGGIRRQAQDAGATIVDDVPARDHQRYDPAMLEAIRRRCEGLDAVVCTGKDWAKLARLIDAERWPCPIVVPELRLEFLAGEEELVRRVVAALAPSGSRPVERSAADPPGSI